VNQNQPVGYHEVIWDGANSRGQRVSTGIYLYRMDAGHFTDIKKMIFLK